MLGCGRERSAIFFLASSFFDSPDAVPVTRLVDLGGLSAAGFRFGSVISMGACDA